MGSGPSSLELAFKIESGLAGSQWQCRGSWLKQELGAGFASLPHPALGSPDRQEFWGRALLIPFGAGRGGVRNPAMGLVSPLLFWALWDTPGEHWLPTQGQQGERGRSLWINKS